MIKNGLAVTGMVAVLALAAVPAPTLADGDPAAGQRVFRQCQACHVADKEQNRVGPHLVGIIGRPAGTVDGFKYSDAMANSGVTWTEETIGEYLADPRGYIAGNRMVFAGLRNQADIDDVIAYLKSLDG